MGIILALGLTELWPLTIALALGLFYWKRNELRIRIPPTVIGIGGILLISAFFGPTFKAFYYVSAMGVAAVIIKYPPEGKKLWYPIYGLAAIQLVWGTVEYLFGVTRIHGLSQNASVYGLLGLAVPISIVGPLLIGVSLSRTALIGMALFAILRNRKIVWGFLLLAIVLHVSITFIVAPARNTPNEIAVSTELRTQAVTGENTEPVQDVCGGRKDRQLKLFGYGYGGYCLSTGQIQPHNIYVLSVWELGILAVPFWVLVLLLLKQSRNPYLLIFVFLSLLVDEWYTDIEGIYYLALFHILTKRLTLAPYASKLLGMATGRSRFTGKRPLAQIEPPTH